VVLLTPDDVGAAKDSAGNLNSRARQKVILEFGYFVGRLGRKNVCALHRNGVELASNYMGAGYVWLESGVWQFPFAKELQGSGFER